MDSGVSIDIRHALCHLVMVLHRVGCQMVLKHGDLEVNELLPDIYDELNEVRSLGSRTKTEGVRRLFSAEGGALRV